MGGRIDARADTAIAGTAGARREWPGLRQILAWGLGATAASGLWLGALPREAGRCAPDGKQG